MKSKIFDNNPANTINWANHEVKFYTIERNFNLIHLILPTLLITLIVGFLGC